MSGVAGTRAPAGGPAGAAPVAASPARRARRRLPAALWVAVAAAVLNGIAWGLITPSFQSPDEPVHVGYAQYLAETGDIPRPTGPNYRPSRDAEVAFNGIPWSLSGHPSWSASNDRRLHAALRADLGRVSEGAAGYIAPSPPLYYALEAVAYRAAYHANFLDRLYAMRLVSALLAGLTAAFTFLFLRELLPSRPWVWMLGTLAVVFQPLFGFISGGVDNDNLLWTASAALFWQACVALRRGLTLRRGAAIGAALAVGVLAKSSMFALAPGVALALALAVLRPVEGSPPLRGRLAGAVTGLVVAGLPILGWLVANQLLLDRGGSTTAGLTQVRQVSIGGQLSYLWQFWLPRLPFMNDWFPKYPYHPVWDTYFQGFVGRFGWFTFGFQTWVYELAVAVAVAVLALAATALVRHRAVLRRRWPELVTYLALGGGLALLLNVVGYRYRAQTGTNFEQARYLLPLLPLYGALIALAAIGAGRRFGPLFAAAFVVLAIGHSLFSQLLTVAHYFS